MAKDVTRYIKKEVERELWGRAAGRCEFDGCNKLLYKSSVTQETVNISEKAHIYSFSEKGPRGWGPFALNKSEINNITNLMLMCHECHKTIDQDKEGKRYSADLLQSWKKKHEERIGIVSGITNKKKSHVVLYGANVGNEKSPVQFVDAAQAMFPSLYPADEKAIILSMISDHKDDTELYWETESQHLATIFERKINSLIEDDSCKHFSVFGLAPQPLLIKLGCLFTDKISVESYQLHREPKTWMWQENPNDFEYILNSPNSNQGTPVLVLSLSDKVSNDRITKILGKNINIWELTLKDCHNDFLKSQSQLIQFRQTVRKLMVDIKKQHGNSTPLHIFPVMPVSCAVELGRIRMPKADMPWIIYDQSNKLNGFIKAMEIA